MFCSSSSLSSLSSSSFTSTQKQGKKKDMSILPCDMQEHILSFLDAGTVATTACVSKSWSIIAPKTSDYKAALKSVFDQILPRHDDVLVHNRWHHDEEHMKCAFFGNTKYVTH